MAHSTAPAPVLRHHHVTLCTGCAQEDFEFHTGVLGLKSVKKTIIYDGQMPIYHLYYGNDLGEESTLVTSFPMAHTGQKARRGSGVDLVTEPDRRAGTWTFGEGSIHHGAFQVESFEVQRQVKDGLEGLGFTDCSDRKDRGYFHSVYVRTPSGALFEPTVSKPEGFTIDESIDRLGQEIMIAPQFESRRDEILAQLEPLTF